MGALQQINSSRVGSSQSPAAAPSNGSKSDSKFLATPTKPSLSNDSLRKLYEDSVRGLDYSSGLSVDRKLHRNLASIERGLAREVIEQINGCLSNSKLEGLHEKKSATLSPFKITLPSEKMPTKSLEELRDHISALLKISDEYLEQGKLAEAGSLGRVVRRALGSDLTQIRELTQSGKRAQVDLDFVARMGLELSSVVPGSEAFGLLAACIEQQCDSKSIAEFRPGFLTVASAIPFSGIVKILGKIAKRIPSLSVMRRFATEEDVSEFAQNLASFQKDQSRVDVLMPGHVPDLGVVTNLGAERLIVAVDPRIDPIFSSWLNRALKTVDSAKLVGVDAARKLSEITEESLFGLWRGWHPIKNRAFNTISSLENSISDSTRYSLLGDYFAINMGNCRSAAAALQQAFQKRGIVSRMVGGGITIWKDGEKLLDGNHIWVEAKIDGKLFRYDPAQGIHGAKISSSHSTVESGGLQYVYQPKFDSVLFGHAYKIGAEDVTKISRLLFGKPLGSGIREPKLSDFNFPHNFSPWL